MNIIGGNSAGVVLYVLVGTFDQQCSDGPAALEHVDAADRQMQRSEAVSVLNVDFRVLSENVLQGRLGMGVACPMERRAVSGISRVDIHPD